MTKLRVRRRPKLQRTTAVAVLSFPVWENLQGNLNRRHYYVHLFNKYWYSDEFNDVF